MVYFIVVHHCFPTTNFDNLTLDLLYKLQD
jgi:hypothetical protein